MPTRAPTITSSAYPDTALEAHRSTPWGRIICEACFHSAPIARRQRGERDLESIGGVTAHRHDHRTARGNRPVRGAATIKCFAGIEVIAGKDRGQRMSMRYRGALQFPGEIDEICREVIIARRRGVAAISLQ